MLSKLALLQPIRRANPHLDDLQGVIDSIESDLLSIEEHDFSNGSTAIQVRQLAFLLESNGQKIRQLAEHAHEGQDDKRRVEETFATLMQDAASRDIKNVQTERLNFEDDVVADILPR
ncbi:hypothetical protein DFQ28_011500 [Apophysomyces sp. BC1034]|nr:hypothetical protein DFQ30_011159 [Apophysomyces sp. BC1015]KAG0181123.1 hypothetical protein DFQ29_009282 [Apophysomyces sp. BC1021]KAG0191587.1 hypothetical protein DFQ28_011500 [Apophysomyces sp. BC1034]